ncbi:MAG: alpha/beta hydrolase [Sphingomonas sp.]
MTAPLLDRRALPEGLVVDAVTMADGWALRRMRWAAGGRPRGALLFLSGRADFGEKYLEAMAGWRARGWSVTSFDWRGQGGSAGGTEAAPDFDVLLDDLAAMIASWAVDAPVPRVVVAHSMGGHLALRLMAERGWRPDAAVLSAPMIGIETGPLPFPVAAAIARAACLAGLGGRGLWRTAGTGTLRQATLTGSAARYADEGWWVARHPGYAALPPRWAWLDAACRSIATLRASPLETVTVPILFLTAARERLVSNRAIADAARRLPAARLLRFEQAAHELLREDDALREAAMAAIDTFFDAAAPA